MKKQVEELQELDMEYSSALSGGPVRRRGVGRKQASNSKLASRKGQRTHRKGNTIGGMHQRGDKRTGR
jgi:hypothetical protein